MSVEVDYLIIGAGPAGLQLGYFLDRAGRDYLILDADESVGSFFKRFPRHGQLLTANKVHTGYEDENRRFRYDWNSLICDSEELLFRNFSSEFLPKRKDFLRYLDAFANHYQLNIRFNTKAVRISKAARFRIETNTGEVFVCKRLVIAAGVSKPYIPAIPGIELAENYSDCSVDRQDFINQRVLILGKGNSAFETANHLIPAARTITVCGPECITMAWSSHYKGDLRAVNAAFIDTYHLKSLNHILNAEVTQIERSDGGLMVRVAYQHAQGQTMELMYDRIIVCTGFRMDTDIFAPNCMPEMLSSLDDRFPAFTAEWESSNIKDMYFVGVLMGARDQRKYFSSFVQGFRQNIQVLGKLLEQKYHNTPLAWQAVAPEPAAMAKKIIHRVSSTAALLLQPGYLCDLLVLVDGGNRVHYYHEINMDYVFDSALSSNKHYYTVTLEYGEFREGDPLCQGRDPDPSQAHKDVYVHPVVRRYNEGRMLEELHIPEALENDWEQFQFLSRIDDIDASDILQSYIDRLQCFFTRQLSDLGR